MTINVSEIIMILSKLALIPDQFRRFTIDSEVAIRHYGIQTVLLDELISNGLPKEEQGATTYFDPLDLTNISLHLRLPSMQRLAMRTWSRTLQLADAANRHNAEILIRPLSEIAGGEAPIDIVCLELPHGRIDAPEHIRPLLEQFSKFEFYMLPEYCRWDISFIAKNRICECGGGSKLLMQMSLERGIDARQCFGMLIAEPYSTGHYWAEFLINSEWIPFDPLLIRLLLTATLLPSNRWPIYRSTSIALNRLCVINEYDHCGAPILDVFREKPFTTNPISIIKDHAMIVSLPTQITIR